MHISAFTLARKSPIRAVLPTVAISPLRTALTLAFTTLALAGCGGSSDSAEPPAPPASNGLAAPESFAVGRGFSFTWKATPEATRYELFADPDGTGPLPEAQMGDSQNFQYSSFNQQFSGSLRPASYATFINATYRLRACNANGCGAFASAPAFDLAKLLSYEFPAGRAMLEDSSGNNSSLLSLSQDGLTLAVKWSDVHVFARNSTTSLWQQQAQLASAATRIVLSADGGTLAASGFANSDGRVQLYQRNNGTWSLQTTIGSAQAPSTCPQPCQVLGDNTALSADGQLVAVTGRSGSGNYPANAVFTYVRSGSSWAPQGYLAPGANVAGDTMALSADGRTLVVNGGAFDRGSYTTPPKIHVFAQGSGGAWSEQARMPVGIVGFLDISGTRYSAAVLSSDGKTLAVEAQHLPGKQPAEFNISAADLTCGSKAPWTTEPMTGYSTEPGWHVALFARDGSTWRRQAILARDTRPWALATDGNTIFYGGELFTRRNGAWTCP